MKTYHGILIALVVGIVVAVGLIGWDIHSLRPGPDSEAPPESEPPNTVRARASDGDGFHFPADRGGELLSELLPPAENEFVGPPASFGPQALRPPALPGPEPAFPANQASVPRLPRAQHGDQPAAPGGLREDAPLPIQPPLPTYLPPQVLPAAAGVRLPSPDVDRPSPLPGLAQWRPDRVSLEQLTHQASLDAALVTSFPGHSAPIPASRLLPSQPAGPAVAIHPRLPWAETEATAPVSTAPKPPRP
jgi:hypothetical protein